MGKNLFEVYLFTYSSAAEVRPEINEEGFMTYAVTHHQGVIKTFLALLLQSSHLSDIVYDVNKKDCVN